MENTVSYDSQTIVQLFKLAIYGLVAVLVSFTVTAIVAFMRVPEGKNPADTFSLMFERAKLLQMIAVCLIVASATLLGLLKIIDANGTVAILSGIAGYVLGGLQKEPKEA